jgi:hypothetical protein
MRHAKRILVAAAIFSSYSAALAFDEKEIDSALQKGTCKFGEKIDDRELPNFDKCKKYEPDRVAVNNCQGHEQSLFDKIERYNKACRHHADSSGGSSSKKSTDNGAPAAKPNAPTASNSAAKARERLQQLSSGSSTLSSNKDITITNSAGNITFHGFGSTPLQIQISHRPNCFE